MSNNAFVSLTRTGFAAAFEFGTILASASSAAANPNPVGLGHADGDASLLAVVALPRRVPVYSLVIDYSDTTDMCVAVPPTRA